MRRAHRGPHVAGVASAQQPGRGREAAVTPAGHLAPRALSLSPRG